MSIFLITYLKNINVSPFIYIDCLLFNFKILTLQFKLIQYNNKIYYQLNFLSTL